MLREAATTLEAFKGTGSVARRQTFQHGLFIEPARIRFFRNGGIITEPEDVQERAIHVMTALGPRSTLKKEDIVNPGAHMRWNILVVVPGGRESAHITMKMLEDWLTLGQKIGLGGSRSQGYGQFMIREFSEGRWSSGEVFL